MGQLINQQELLQDVYYTGEDLTFDQVLKEIKGDQEKEIKEAISRIRENGLKKGIGRLCAAAKRDDPNIKPEGIRKKVIDHVCPHIWLESSVRNYWPKWMINHKIESARAANRLAREEAEKMQIFESLTQNQKDKDEEQKPVQSWTLAEYEETHPQVAESPWEAIGEINRSIARLWTALTKQKNMPTRKDDVMKDYIIPARERLKDIANGSSKTERDFLFNWLTWTIMAAKDCRDVFEKADKTAYDTRE